MRASSTGWAGLWIAVAIALVDCGATESGVVRVPAGARSRSPSAADFSAERAWGHLEALTKLGPRVAGTDGAEAARQYIRAQLEELGLEVKENAYEVKIGNADEPLRLVHLTAIVPGESPDVFLLAAPYDTQHFDSFRFVGANEGGSGPALLLELARVLSTRGLPYTVWLTFLDGEAEFDDGSGGVAELVGSYAFALELSALGVLPRIRLAVVLNQVADADLVIARDLYSYTRYRETFWSVAEDLGRAEAFPPNADFETPNAAHRSLREQGLRRVVAIVDTRYGGDEVPGVYWRTEDDDLDHCSAESLETVGLVTLETLDVLSQQLSTIDRFARSPLAEAPTEAEEEPGDASGPDETAAPSEQAPADAGDAGDEPASGEANAAGDAAPSAEEASR